MSELSPLGGSEREGELAQRAKRGRPGAYGACDDEGAVPCGRPRAGEDTGPYGQQRTEIFVGAAPMCAPAQPSPHRGEGGICEANDG